MNLELTTNRISSKPSLDIKPIWRFKNRSIRITSRFGSKIFHHWPITTQNFLSPFRYVLEQKNGLKPARIQTNSINILKDTPLICEFAQYSVPLKNKVFSLNSMFNYFHLFETEKWRSEIYKKIIQKYESCLWRHLSSFLYRSPKIEI